MSSGGGCLDFHVECRQCGVLDRPKFSLQGSIGGANLEHHTHEIIDEGLELVAELYNRLSLFLARVEELLLA